MVHNPQEATDGSLSLYDLLWEQYSASENYYGQKFLCMETVAREFNYGRIRQWIAKHPLHRRSEGRENNANLIKTILTNSRLVFAMLVLGELEYLFSTLVLHGFCDDMLFDTRLFEECCIAAEVTERERYALANFRNRIGAMLRNDRHQVFLKGIVLPYRNVNHPKEDRFGGFGVVRRVEVAAGHLRGFHETIVAMKQIRPMNNESKDEWEQLYREVDTLQKTRHPNIVPLLASYYLDTIDSSDRPLRTLYLLFPWAEMDLEAWMNSPQIPMSIKPLSRNERRAYIYQSISALVSGLAYLHRESGGLITSHHDLKPSNILVIGQDFKIADLGRSHLRPADGSSETEGASGLGTYEYQPPEYWQNNGSRAKVRHGRAFDIWAMGCILIELATLIVDNWDSQMVSAFRQERAANLAPDRSQLAESRKYGDSSFHNNWSVVESWIRRLRHHPGSSRTLEEILDVATEMLAHDPRSRLHSWEAEIDLYIIQNPGSSQIASRGKGPLCLQPPWKSRHHGRVLNGSQTPLHRAALKEDRKRLMDLLHLGWPVLVQDQGGHTTLDIVKRSADKYLRESLSLYLGQGIAATRENHGMELLETAESGDTISMRHLLKRGVSPLLVNSEGRSALFLAVARGHVPAIDELLGANTEEQLLLKDRVSGDTVLHMASSAGSEDAIKQLLLYLPDLEDRQHEGKTALFLAAENNYEKVVKILLDHVPKAQVFTQSNTGDTPLHIAATRDKELMEVLLNAEDSTKCLEHKNQLGETPVWLAVRHKNIEGFRILKERGASLSVADNNKDNLLHLVAQQRLYDFLNQNLHAFNASDIEERNRWNDTPLTIADRGGYLDITGLLRSYYTGNIFSNEDEALNASGTRSSPPKLFYTLGSESKWIREGSEGYWRHLTYESYRIYERIWWLAGNGQRVVQFIDFAKQFNPNEPRPETVEFIWRRLLRSSASDIRNTSHPKPFILAVLYMLHVERFSSERPRGDNSQFGEVKAKRREILKRFDVWVPCTCRKKCPHEWNFANDRGIYRSASEDSQKCRILQLLEGYNRTFFGITQSREAGDCKIWNSMLDLWKKSPAQI